MSDLDEQVAERLAAVRERVRRAGGDEVRIVGVTKGRPAEYARAALAAGLTDLGENYAQELVGKAHEVGVGGGAGSLAVPGTIGPTWHFVGRLQSNKVRSLVPIVALYQSVDRASLVDELARRAPGARVLVQVDLAGIPGRGGCQPDRAADLVERATGAGLEVEGLMGVAPPADHARVDDRTEVAASFARLRSIRDDLGLRELSMGMTGDLEEAVAEGATIVRIGTALFGPRPVR